MLNHLQRGTTDPVLTFSTLVQLVSGGDDTSFCQETDDDVPSQGGIYGLTYQGVQEASYPQHGGAQLIAGYVVPAPSTIKPPPLRDWEQWIKYFDRGDPAAFRRILEEMVREMQERVRSTIVDAPDVFEELLRTAREMGPSQLDSAIREAKALVGRGEAALRSLEAMAKRSEST
jgi:hypothetical protein